MPISQQPTLNPIDPDKNQYEIVFGVQMVSGDNPQKLNIPNLGGGTFDVYPFDLTSVKTPARGNFGSIRCVQFVLRTIQIAGATDVTVGNVFLVNIQTQQVLAILAPTPGPGFSSLVMGNLSFFAKSNQTIAVCRDVSVNCTALLSVSAFTFDCSNFLTSMIPAPTLYDNGTTAVPQVFVTNAELAVNVQNAALDVQILGQPILVTTTP
jgi:hypothetical protein